MKAEIKSITDNGSYISITLIVATHMQTDLKGKTDQEIIKTLKSKLKLSTANLEME